MARLGGKVTRRPASDVYAEVASAENASFEEGVDALKARIHEHRAERKDEWEAFKTNAKAKMS